MEFMKARGAETVCAPANRDRLLCSCGTACRSSSAFPGAMPPGVPAFIIWVAGPLELFGGILVMIGLFTRPVAFVLSGLMAFAYWMGHGLNALLPILNQASSRWSIASSSSSSVRMARASGASTAATDRCEHDHGRDRRTRQSPSRPCTHRHSAASWSSIRRSARVVSRRRNRSQSTTQDKAIEGPDHGTSEASACIARHS